MRRRWKPGSRPKGRQQDHRKPAPDRAHVSLTPSADRRLKAVFRRIGIPEPQPFQPDPFQLEALELIQKADCLVSAPTGSGKTWIAVQAIRRILESGGRSWYASPLKALSNAKYRELIDLFGADRVGILTGDRKENPQAPIIVGTTEILRNQLYDAMHHGETIDTDFVVLDEAHYLGDEDRGVVWEETMIYLPSRVPILMLSATIGNAAGIAVWLESIRGRPCSVVLETKRPVPLVPLFLHPSGKLMPLLGSVDVTPGSRISGVIVKWMKTDASRSMGRALPPLGEILRVLESFDLLPAIFFLKSRLDCDRAIGLCASEPLTDALQKRRIRERLRELAGNNPHLSKHRQGWELVHLGVASHHGGQLPAWKIVVESLMTEGLLKAVFATSTVAAGVNFPARTVVFLNTDRFNGREFLPLTPTEFHQMTGRAGRRGMDKIGFAVSIPGPYLDPMLYAKLVTASPSDVRSQLKIDFSMVLNLLLSHTPDRIEDLLERSFAAFSHRKGVPKGGEAHPHFLTELVESFRKHFDFLQEADFANPDGSLTEDGLWASKLRIDHPVEIAAGFRMGVFPDSDTGLLAAMVAVFVSERETSEMLNRRILPENLVRAFHKMRRGLRPFLAFMRSRGFEAKKLEIGPSAVMYAWASGMEWDEVVKLSEMTDGDVVMLVLRTADNLRHIRTLDAVFPAIARAADDALNLLLREPVTMDDF